MAFGDCTPVVRATGARATDPRRRSPSCRCWGRALPGVGASSRPRRRVRTKARICWVDGAARTVPNDSLAPHRVPGTRTRCWRCSAPSCCTSPTWSTRPSATNRASWSSKADRRTDRVCSRTAIARCGRSASRAAWRAAGGATAARIAQAERAHSPRRSRCWATRARTGLRPLLQRRRSQARGAGLVRRRRPPRPWGWAVAAPGPASPARSAGCRRTPSSRSPRGFPGRRRSGSSAAFRGGGPPTASAGSARTSIGRRQERRRCRHDREPARPPLS